MTLDSALNGLLRLVLPAAAIAAAALAVFAVLNQLALDRHAAERRALADRNAQLTISALAPGSALGCLDGGAGEAAETACEAAIFASPQSTAAAVTYIGAKLALLADAQAFDPDVAGRFASSRRALELDRFGIAAHVLSWRDGCTPDACAAFVLLADAAAIKANMKAQAFDQYVSRHTAAWATPASPPPTPLVSQAPAAPAPAAGIAALPASAEPTGQPVSSKYTFPSAASIPAISIMNAEPPLSKAAAEALAAQPKPDAKAQADVTVPVPPKRPQAPPDQADRPAAR